MGWCIPPPSFSGIEVHSDAFRCIHSCWQSAANFWGRSLCPPCSIICFLWRMPTSQSWAMWQCFSFATTTTRQRVRASMTSKNTKHVKASVSKWSRHNEYSHAARSNNFWPENMVTLSQQLSSGPSSADHVGLWPLPGWLSWCFWRQLMLCCVQRSQNSISAKNLLVLHFILLYSICKYVFSFT